MEEILEFWFGKAGEEGYGKQRQEWFVKKDEFDREVRSRFLDTYDRAAAGELDEWKNNPDSCLALIIVLDQFSRNMFRGQPQAFATDEKALELAKYAVSKGYDKELLPVQRWFIYLPFEHSEKLADQERCLELFSSLESDPESASSIDYAKRHYQVIKRFGRFPHRNSILGRKSTKEEIEFLQQPGSSF
ncbi:DUF924 family protein [Oscillatoria salina]|uniref:DUF924 family protein n=1 Tax=Oscillatoria salina TaxID=331517 RepID=UPI001CCF46AC|nr:DUF924 family protein [Oscillatoria salina]MBZ8182786.1 DUF924 domain-containing protein [Oscillatoria salina IIICB1]